MSEQQIEAIAKAIWETRDGVCEWENIAASGRLLYLQMAENVAATFIKVAEVVESPARKISHQNCYWTS